MVTDIKVCDDYVVITEEGKDYVCDNNPAVIAGNLLIAEFHPRGNRRKTFLVELLEDEETMEQTYQPFSSKEDEEKARKMYSDIMDCM